MWRYLQEHFTTVEDILGLGKLPLIPLSMAGTPVTLTRLCHPSRVVVKRLNDDCLDDKLAVVLMQLGLIVMTDYPTFIRHHPAVLGTFVNPPTTQGVLHAMVVSSNQMTAGTFSGIVHKVLSSNDKHLLRSFLANVKRIGPVEYNLLCSLPIFETLSKKFVSEEEGLCAAPDETLPVAPLQELIDVTQQDSKALARILNVKILKPTELLCQIVFPDIQRGRYSGEQIDKLMTYVLDRYASEIHRNTIFKQNLEALSFVSKQEGRARASDLFDSRNVILRKIFAKENVFPTASYTKASVLVMLEELGMKSECSITGYNLYQSANLVSRLSDLSVAEQKSKAIFRYVCDNPSKLLEPIHGQPLWALLRDIPWVSRLQKRPPNYPPGLAWWKTDEEEGKHFFKPTEVKSHHMANLIGTVMPVVEVETSCNISKYFDWQNQPSLIQVVQHLQTVVRSYSKEEKPFYMVVVNQIYLFLSRAKYANVNHAFDCLGKFDWVWNGDGFSSPNNVLSKKPHIDLTPYIRSLPSDMIKYCNLFYRFGMRERIDPAVLVQVLTVIKEKYDDESVLFSALEVKHDLQLSVNILNELANEELSDELQAQIVLPTHTKSNSCVRLEPVERCMYCEREWLKGEGDDEDIDYFYVHPNVPNSTADRLGVPTLTSRMLDADELSIGEEFGQTERLTTRLNRLLEEYTDGFSVLKELVQNADDAGATEVKFLYDERKNEDAMTCLLDEGMKGCQGPALWVYNDAEFKDEDFENIAKLNEATKEHDTEKIGRFGLGFNAVYNLTDVPMFLSRNYFAIFDPHTTYLGKAIKNKRRPGMKIDLNRDVKRLRKFTNQFKPFNGIFGCDLHLEKDDNSFDGTLFRFPLRTSEQASRSEIKRLAYNDQQMKELLLMLVNGAKTLLLFTQNVINVSIFSLKTSGKKDQNAKLAFQVSKSLSQAGIVRKLSVPVTLPATAKKLTPGDQDFLKQCNVLQASSQVTRAFRKGAKTKLIKSSMKIDIKCSFTEFGRGFFASDLPFDQECSTWLVVSSMGSGPALHFAKNDLSLLPSAGVAVQLVQNGSDNCLPLPVVKRVDGYFINGILFCYLPLPIHSGLPVHVNGAFALAANRRHLQQKLEDDKKCYGVDWNNVLMQDSISSAYLCLLEDLSSIAPSDGRYKFHSLWPKVNEVDRNCLPLVKSFYTQIARGSYCLFSDGREWLDINQVVFLDPDFRNEPIVGDISLTVFKMLIKGSAVVIDAPLDVLRSFQICGLGEKLKPKIYNKGRFFHELFFPKISTVPPELRDALVLHALDTNCDELIRTHACIPASPFGKTLKYPFELIHPDKEAAKLFLPEDGRFPCGTKKSFLDSQRLAKLETLGMLSDDLPWQEIAERAESIQGLNAANCDAAFKRMKSLLQFLDKKVKNNDKNCLNDATRTRILEAKFLPVLKKPNAFPLPWKSDEFGSKVLLAPKEVYLEEEKYLLCCTEPLVGVYITRDVKALLKLRKKHATLDHVVSQLNVAMSSKIDWAELTAVDEINFLCNAAYSYLQKALESNATAVEELLQGKKIILAGTEFLCANQMAFRLAIDCSPYLYKLPEPLAVAFPKLMKVAGVRENFEEEDFIVSLRQMKKLFSETELDERSLQVAVHLADQLGKTLRASGVDPSEVQDKWGTVYLPDSRGVMRPVPELCIKNCPWMLDEPDVNFVNASIPWPTCDQIGVKTRREEALRYHAVGIPFGQREKLTNRLKRILKAYPCEKEILKELLQNADDAQATEICFIKDPRHHPDERVFEDKWQPLQGPALCVYNNKPFTNADIEGIQNLGEGSKGDDPNKTGQYGVGFNAVYHLTDVPSFMSKGDEIGDVLCAFDPHCKYVPGASLQKPGCMFKDASTLRRKFPDVFPCYLVDHFSIDNATIFRFPLRTENMARDSQISSNAVSVRELDVMMDELKKELFEVLLFVNNVKKITLCEISETGDNLVNAYTVEAALSNEDEAKRQAFSEYIKQIGKLASGGRVVVPTEVSVAKVSYVLNITDTLGNQEKWLIVQQIGFEKSVKTSVVNAFKEHQLGMLPRGGVACLLEKRDPRHPVQRPKKVYCFLPLPFETDLPVHVNGHFALDHEARRNLWRDEAGGYRSDWNNALLRDVVTSCYLTLLVEVRNFLNLPISQDANPGTEHETLEKINVYETFFPRQPPTDRYWKTLVDSVYQEINRKELQILPVVRNRQLDTQKSITVVEVTWLPPTSTGKYQAFFNNLAVIGPFAMSPQKETDENQAKIRKMFESILLESGYNLVAFSLALHESFQRAGVTTSSISPSSVIDFFRTFSSQDPFCRIGPIPCSVNETTLKDALGVIVVLLYCNGDASFLDKQPGLPLLLTQDNRLQLFSSRQPKFLSLYHDILPGSPHIFLHEQVHRTIFSDTATANSTVLKPLDAKAFTVYLPQTLPWGCYGNDEFVQWSPNQKATPNQRWIFRVWVFLHELTRDVLEDGNMDDQAKNLHIKTALEPLSNWSILPVTEAKSTERKTSLFSFFPSNTPPPVEHFLVPLGKAASVLDFKNADSSSRKLVDALRKLGLPELNSAVLSTTGSGTSAYSSPNSVRLARMIVSSLKAPASLLTSLSQKMALDAQLLKRLEPQDCRTILNYFCSSVSCLRDADRAALRRLPFYQATHGGLIRLDDRRVCVLPIGIPRKEMDVLESELRVVFLESWQSLSELFKFLALECVCAVDVYCTFILPNFSILSKEARQVHLKYIRKSILENALKNGEKEKLLQCLTNTPLVPSADGTLKTASSFYDPQIDVFCNMLSESMFPSEPFNSPEWLMFLRSIGLVHEVTKDHFKRFATDVADEAAFAPSENTCKKSKVLVNHLIHRHNVVAEGLLQSICDIPFVAGDPVRETLQALCLPFGGVVGRQIPFIAFKGAVPTEHAEIVWTKAHLLPWWANPMRRRRELNNPISVDKDKFCNAFVTQLQIVVKPSTDLVVAHCQNICLHLTSNSEKLDSSTEQCDTIMAVMERIYSFLQTERITNSDAKKVLENTPCILVDQGKKFILPCQAVLELYEHLEIKPFLYRTPREFGKFHPLFENLGCSKTVTIFHYAMVLDMLQKKCQNSKLDPNEVTVSVKAARGFFERLEENVKEVNSLTGLYLPGISLRESSSEGTGTVTPLFLYKSPDLIFNDAPRFRNRLHNFNQIFLLDLRVMNVTCSSANTNYKELIMKLPTALQPKMLSSVVKEQLCVSHIVETVMAKAVTKLKHQISSAQFCSGVIRLIRDANCRQKRDVDDGVIENIGRRLRRIELCVVKSLKTTLLSEEVPIPESEAEVKQFLDKVVVCGEEIWRVYIDVASAVDESSSAISLVSSAVVQICGGLLGMMAVFIPEMLRCPLSNIWSLLDSVGVRQDDSYREPEVKIYHEPGSFIPLEDHHLLNDAFEEFDPGDYVGYELEDPSLHGQEGNATYIYAVIIEKVTNEGGTPLTKRYRIDIGDGQEIVVDAADLYKFHRLNVSTSTAIVSSDQPREAPIHRSRQEVFDEISDQLEDAWKLPGEKRRKIIKRLYLRWHPDKNLGDEEFCNEVCQHIQNETCRLERGEPRDSQSSGAEAQSRGGLYDDFFTFWGTRARQHHAQRQGYSTRQQFPRSSYRKNPQPGEARRWFKQANADLAAVENDVVYSKPSYEWACFKCHQVSKQLIFQLKYI